MENKIYKICHNLKQIVKGFIIGIIYLSIIFIFGFAGICGPLLIGIKIIGDRPVNSVFDVILMFILVVLPYFIGYLFQEKIGKILIKIGNFIENCINA
jgi:hypothetical protein